MSLVTLFAAGNSGASPPAGGACSSYLLAAGETNIVLDIGPGSLPHMRTQIGVWDIDAIFISHMHTDHWLDLLALNVALFTQDGGPAAQGRKIPVYLPPGGRETLAAAFAGLATGVQGTNASRWEQALDATEYDPARPVTIGDFEVRFVGPMKHATLAYGMRATANGITVGYTGDTAYCPQAVEVGRDADVMLAECTELEKGAWSETHTTAAELGELAAEAKPRLLLATHLSQTDAAYRQQVRERVRRGWHGPLEVVTIGAKYVLFR